MWIFGRRKIPDAILTWVLALLLLGIPGTISSASSGRLDRWGSQALDGEEGFDYTKLPERLAAPALRPLWERGIEYERQRQLLAAAEVYEEIAGRVSEESYICWRIARNYWRHAEALPLSEKRERLRYFDLSELWAARGLAADPDCAACMLWKFVSMGRQATTRGLLTAVADVGEMEYLLRRGIELRPEHRDNAGNLTLGNLYYAASVFYRILPEWRWLKWVFGVRGDLEKASGYAKNAVEIAELRVDYRVELGASLLCLGLSRKNPEILAQGMETLRAARKLEDYLITDALDKEHAGILIESPGRACGYSRDGFIDVDRLGRQVRMGKTSGQ